jgi:hypothetical protein
MKHGHIAVLFGMTVWLNCSIENTQPVDDIALTNQRSKGISRLKMTQGYEYLRMVNIVGTDEESVSVEARLCRMGTSATSSRPASARIRLQPDTSGTASLLFESDGTSLLELYNYITSIDIRCSRTLSISTNAYELKTKGMRGFICANVENMPLCTLETAAGCSVTANITIGQLNIIIARDTTDFCGITVCDKARQATVTDVTIILPKGFKAWLDLISGLYDEQGCCTINGKVFGAVCQATLNNCPENRRVIKVRARRNITIEEQ